MSVMSSIASRVARDEQGFSIMELLVAMITGLVVVFSLFTILEVTVRQTSRLTDTVQADTLGRATLTRIVDELHTACIGREFTPVQAGSTGKELIFRTAYGEGALIEKAQAAEHRIVWKGTWPSYGELIDKTIPATAGTAPNFTYSGETPTGGVRIGQYVYETEESGKAIPIFRYERYATKSSDSETTGLSTLEAFTPPSSGLAAPEAKTVAAVQVSFATAATGSKAETKLFREDEFASLVTFAFAAPASEATIMDAPCQ